MWIYTSIHEGLKTLGALGFLGDLNVSIYDGIYSKHKSKGIWTGKITSLYVIRPGETAWIKEENTWSNSFIITT